MEHFNRRKNINDIRSRIEFAPNKSVIRSVFVFAPNETVIRSVFVFAPNKSVLFGAELYSLRIIQCYSEQICSRSE
jgi:hypothetical protein